MTIMGQMAHTRGRGFLYHDGMTDTDTDTHTHEDLAQCECDECHTRREDHCDCNNCDPCP
jgi:hypothetical protein